MTYRYKFISFFFLLALTGVLSGCVSVRLADTHNTTIAVRQYNDWTSGQQAFDGTARGAITQIGEHVDTYNREIAKDEPDYPLLRQNLAADRQLLDRWDSELDNLTRSTDEFEQKTSILGYDNASSARVKETLGMMTQYMKIYGVHMGNSRQYLIEYINNAESYIGPEDPDYWNEKYRQAAMQAKDQGIRAVTDGDLALGNLTAHAKKLEDLQ